MSNLFQILLTHYAPFKDKRTDIGWGRHPETGIIHYYTANPTLISSLCGTWPQNKTVEHIDFKPSNGRICKTCRGSFRFEVLRFKVIEDHNRWLKAFQSSI